MSKYKKIILEIVDSTNKKAKDMLKSIDGDFVVVSGEQTGGKGRFDRVWESKKGGAYPLLFYW
jgi:BirA family biotin operon repressor/biotin-[acetyl-CoA-carboxylase] ligase